jgi:hypothetical protein
MRVNETAAPRAAVEPSRGGFGDALRRRAVGPRAADPAELRPVPHDDARAALAPDPARGDAAADPAHIPELAALVRKLPAAIEAARVREGAPLALSFGRSLEVDLRAGAAGIEVVLRPEPRLARAADAEVPRIVAALRARGIAVSRAEVRPRGGGRGAAR